MTAPALPRSGFAVEQTPIGPQSLVPGVAPINLADRLRWRADAPLEPKAAQRPCDHGLFDLAARDQLDLFAALRALDTAGPAVPPAPINELPPSDDGG